MFMSKEEKELITQKRKADARAEQLKGFLEDLTDALRDATNAKPASFNVMRLSAFPLYESPSEKLRRVINRLIREELKAIASQGSN